MPTTKNETAERHREAAALFQKAAIHQHEAAKHYDEGNYEKAAHHSITARGLEEMGMSASNKAAESHYKIYGNKV